MLPRGTWLGELSVFEVYAEHDGPRLFSVVDGFGKYYLAVATDEEDEYHQWLYVPVSAARLTALRIGSIDLADPFRRPEGGFAFRVTVWSDGGRVPDVEAVAADALTEDVLPRRGFSLNLAELPTRWRVDAIREAETSLRSAHETRVVRADEDGLTAPTFVSKVIRRWGALAAALVPRVDIHVAAVAPGSLRAIFAAPTAKQRGLVEEYAALLACGSDITKLRSELRTPQRASAYYELVHLVSEEECSFEVSTVRRGTRELEVRELTKALAHAQAAGLAEPQLETRERQFVASVTAASLSASTIELTLDDESTVAGTVRAGTNSLTGLRIGEHYRFAIRQTTRFDTPAATPKIDIEIQSADVNFGVLEKSAARPSRPRAKHAKVLEWAKKMSSTDALHAPSGSIRAFVPLTGSGTGLDYAKWFREQLFGDLTWSRTDVPDQEMSAAQFEVTFLGVVVGSNTLTVSHQPNRMRHNREAPTRLHWNPSLCALLKRNNVTGKKLRLGRDETGQFYLIIEDT